MGSAPHYTVMVAVEGVEHWESMPHLGALGEIARAFTKFWVA